ncbi:Tc toxin subunit A-related protein [Candidatus Amoebophilus asiaticus]|uniref:Tc toxin subunit A-related protein n=1 Tax=Candidatus Amoebophilus asiaticus TaxID=281120 RepID=UPI000171352D|nr:hypothetical protein [Candidatus Amoebophilus asiaticus]
MFVLNFEDARYLPFEGTGAVSSWRLDMTKNANPIDFASLTDVVIHLQYTALPGGQQFQDGVKKALGEFKGFRVLSMGQEYASAWYSFIQHSQSLNFYVGPKVFRPNLSDYQVTGINIVLKLTESGKKITDMPKLELNTGASSPLDFTLKKNNAKETVSASVDNQSLDVSTAAQWQLTVKKDVDKLMTNASNMVMILDYTASFK